MVVGFRASHEQVHPRDLLVAVQHVGKEQREFIDASGEKVLGQL